MIGQKMFGFLVYFVCSMFVVPHACAVSSALIQGKGMSAEIRLGMTKQEMVSRIGTPSRIKSEGSCFHYDSLDMAVYFDSTLRAERVYLGRESRSGITKFAPGNLTLDEVFNAFGIPSEIRRLTYTPSPILANMAAVESEFRVPKHGSSQNLPMEYRGQRVLYELHHEGEPLKYKYVLDEDGVAFWFDHRKTLYTAVLYPPPEGDSPAAAAASAERSRTAVVLFDFDKDKVKPLYLPLIRQYAAEVRQQPGGILHIEGHTDSVGSEKYNQRLSERRATSVAKVIQGQGVSKDRFKKVGWGKSRPVADNSTREGRAQNRRVELRIEPSP